MNLRVFVPKFYLDRTELPILNNFPLGIFLATLYVLALPKLWQQVGTGILNAVPDSISWSAVELSDQSVGSDPLIWSIGASIKNVLHGSLWSTSAIHDTATSIPVCEDDFSKYVVGKLAQADDILAGILADQESLLALPTVVNAMAGGISSLRYLQRTWSPDGITEHDRTTPPSPLELVVINQETLLKETSKALQKLPYQHAHLANVTIQEYHQALAYLKEIETFSQKQSGYVKLRVFLSSKYAARSRHSQYFESRALRLVRFHIEYIAPVVDHTLNMTKTLHQMFGELARLPDRLEAVVGVRVDEARSRIFGATTTDSQARMASLLSNFNNKEKINEWLTKKTNGLDWLAKTEEIFPSGNSIYGTKMEEISELYNELSERLDKEVKKDGWFARFRNARSGVVGCAEVVEDKVEDLEYALTMWKARRREWYNVTMNRIREGRPAIRRC